jgi:hypothetical protein
MAVQGTGKPFPLVPTQEKRADFRPTTWCVNAGGLRKVPGEGEECGSRPGLGSARAFGNRGPNLEVERREPDPDEYNRGGKAEIDPGAPAPGRDAGEPAKK